MPDKKVIPAIIFLFFHYVVSQIVHNDNDCEIEKYSFLVKITNIKTLTSTCEGTLVADIWVLTSSKCTWLMESPYEYVIVVGQSRINRANIQVSGIRRVISHSKFNADTSANDIALLELVTPIPETSFVSYVKLPISDADSGSFKSICPVATIIGWKFNQPKCVHTTVIGIKKCTKLYQYQFTNGVICTVNENNERCYGNPGGPLLCGDYQYGITSTDCLLHNELMIFTNVQSYTSFIKDTVRSQSCSIFRLQRDNSFLQLFVYLLYNNIN